MKLVVTEKNIAAQKIADLLGIKKPKADKVYNTPVYRFELDGEEWVTIGLRGHILEPDFVAQIVLQENEGLAGRDCRRRSRACRYTRFSRETAVQNQAQARFWPMACADGAWKMDALPYLAYAPIEKLPKEKDIIRSLKNLAEEGRRNHYRDRLRPRRRAHRFRCARPNQAGERYRAGIPCALFGHHERRNHACLHESREAR